MTNVLTPHKIHRFLIETLTSMSLFAQTLNLTRSSSCITLSAESFSNDLYTLEHNLLSFPSTLPSPAHEPALSVSLRFSALIYLKSVLQEFPHSVNGSRILVEKLRESLALIWVGEGQGMEEGGEEKRALVAWMCVVGAAVAKGDVRAWFLGKLGRMGVHCAAGNETGIERLLSLKNVFDKECLEKI
jgi:Fungal specific transcription factor domain